MKMIIYLIQVSACTGVFYLFYHLLLRQLTFFTINRWYLIGSIILSFLIPTMKIPDATIAPAMLVDRVTFPNAQNIYVSSARLHPGISAVASIDWTSLISICYFCGVAILSFYFIVSLMKIYKRSRGTKMERIGNVKVVNDHLNSGLSSFFNYIFINNGVLNVLGIYKSS